ncbi:benzyl alcohol O-benzoyltransferase-like [Impatiens glandulifera]|uniref:benzyl alcohol O-benzoyltransferase-like n=1 Tax=Impatiens glandulifera TaxID=253017 RepID=UPI001FB0BB6A|nr:benzyl alcohol O-benzoyltransferase-like [Impatiens glandulifera]
MATDNLMFTVRRQEAKLVAPSKSTPCVQLCLSDFDNHKGLRFQIENIFFYARLEDGTMSHRDPAMVMREALAKALVYYYPLAGRLREGLGHKPFVDCTGEGILFIEADANITLQQLGNIVQPPFPNSKELLYNVPGSDNIIGCPLLLIQLTRLKCGGFVFAIRLNHLLCDASGLGQFLIAVGELARGQELSIMPVWKRELLNARDPPRVTSHHESPLVSMDKDNMGVIRSFFFLRTEVEALRKLVPRELHACTTFDLITACLWRCRTIALGIHPDVEVRVVILMNARKKFQPQFPSGYYGNAAVTPSALSIAGKLCRNPLGYAVNLVMKAKKEVTDEYLRSIVQKGRPYITTKNNYFVSDLRHSGFSEIDIGWGKPRYGGGLKCREWDSMFIPTKNERGEDGIVVPIMLSELAMKVFEEELLSLLKHASHQHHYCFNSKSSI